MSHLTFKSHFKISINRALNHAEKMNSREEQDFLFFFYLSYCFPKVNISSGKSFYFLNFFDNCQFGLERRKSEKSGSECWNILIYKWEKVFMFGPKEVEDTLIRKLSKLLHLMHSLKNWKGWLEYLCVHVYVHLIF